MSAVFHNTTREVGDELARAIAQAEKQDDAILAIYRRAREPLSPSQVWSLCKSAGKKWPLTSIRRSITNLTNREQLTQTVHKRVGHYGRYEFCWEVV
jgi:hypothetical protein